MPNAKLFIVLLRALVVEYDIHGAREIVLLVLKCRVSLF